MSEGSDFAKLFRLPGVGQVLVTLDEDDDEYPCVVFRIPDVSDFMLTQAMAFTGDDRDLAWQSAQQAFDRVTEENVQYAIRSLVAARDRLLPGVREGGAA